MGNCLFKRCSKHKSMDFESSSQRSDIELPRVTVTPNPEAQFQRESVLNKEQDSANHNHQQEHRMSIENENFELDDHGETKESILLRKRQEVASKKSVRNSSTSSSSSSSSSDERDCQPPPSPCYHAAATDSMRVENGSRAQSLDMDFDPDVERVKSRRPDSEECKIKIIPASSMEDSDNEIEDADVGLINPRNRLQVPDEDDADDEFEDEDDSSAKRESNSALDKISEGDEEEALSESEGETNEAFQKDNHREEINNRLGRDVVDLDDGIPVMRVELNVNSQGVKRSSFHTQIVPLDEDNQHF